MYLSLVFIDGAIANYQYKKKENKLSAIWNTLSPSVPWHYHLAVWLPLTMTF
jgi:hypothetical protein